MCWGERGRGNGGGGMEGRCVGLFYIRLLKATRYQIAVMLRMLGTDMS